MFQGKIPKDTSTQLTIATKVAEAIKRGKPYVEGVCSIYLRAQDLSPNQQELGREQLLECLIQRFGYEPAVIKDVGEAGYIAVHVRSVQVTKLESAVYDLAKRAIRKQLTGKRPACLAIRIERHSGKSLEALAEEESNWLAKIATKLLKSPAHAHLAAVIFVSAPVVTAVTQYSETEQSKLYFFDSQQGNYPLIGLSQFFGVAEELRNL